MQESTLSQLLSQKLPRSFYLKDTLLIARQLPGKILVYNDGGELFAAKIVETEAYVGKEDESAHSYRGKTERNKVMFNTGGYFYVYFTYGMHFCCNVVVGQEGQGNAVLIRAVEPLLNLEKMKLNRFGKTVISGREFINLTNGPAKLCRAFGFDKKHNGTDLCGNSVFLSEGETIDPERIGVSTRIGIKKSVDLPWRFYIKNNGFVSKK